MLPNTSCHSIRHFGGHLSKMAAISKILRLSQKLRGAEPSISNLCLGVVGHRFQKTYCRIHHAIVSAIVEVMQKNMTAISKVIGLSQKLRGAEPSISTLYLGLCRMCQYWASTIVTFMAAIFTKWQP